MDDQVTRPSWKLRKPEARRVDWLIAGLGGAIVASLAAFIPSLGGKREVGA